MAELLGPEAIVYCMVPVAPVVTPEIEELLADSGTDPSTLGHETTLFSRISPDAPVARCQGR